MPTPRSNRLLPVALLLAVVAACDSKPVPTPAAGAPPTGAAATPGPAPSLAKDLAAFTHPAPKRLVAFGDVHGDLDATQRVLKLAGAIDDAGAWVGGDLVVVQTGDVIDRGDQDREVFDRLDRLAAEAKTKGGALLLLNGNHELMNAQLDFRYVTSDSNKAFDEFASAVRPEVPPVAEPAHGRANAFFPGGVYAKKLAERSMVAIVGDSVFVHGGLLTKHLDYGLARMDGEVRAWLRGERALPSIAVAEDAPVWARNYSAAPSATECAELSKVLGAMGLQRMVMGHTPQKPDISPACDGKAWRIDTGMSHYYSGRVEVLEIVGDDVRVLKE